MKKFIFALAALFATTLNSNAILVTGSCVKNEKITAYTIPSNSKEKSKILDIERSEFDKYVTSTRDYKGIIAVTNGKKTYVFDCTKNPSNCKYHGANFR